MIDLHCHVLPGIDDGPDSIEGSLALARAAAAAGTNTLVATPHVSWRHSPDADTVARSVDELNRHLAAEGVELKVRTGAEIATTRLPDIKPEDLSSLGLGGSSWLLVEPPFAAAVQGLDAMVLGLQRGGHHVLLAHPERCQAFHRNRTMLDLLVRSGVLTSVTAGSLGWRFGREARRFALALVRDGLGSQRRLRRSRPLRSPTANRRRAPASRARSDRRLAHAAGARCDPRRHGYPAATGNLHTAPVHQMAAACL